jgi:hypothetical protein
VQHGARAYVRRRPARIHLILDQRIPAHTPQLPYPYNGRSGRAVGSAMTSAAALRAAAPALCCRRPGPARTVASATFCMRRASRTAPTRCNMQHATNNGQHTAPRATPARCRREHRAPRQCAGDMFGPSASRNASCAHMRRGRSIPRTYLATARELTSASHSTRLCLRRPSCAARRRLWAQWRTASSTARPPAHRSTQPTVRRSRASEWRIVQCAQRGRVFAGSRGHCLQAWPPAAQALPRMGIAAARRRLAPKPTRRRVNKR